MDNKISRGITFDKKKLVTISVCMIVRNSEKELERLLPTIHKSVDEIIIVDTGSVDNTMEVAKKYTDNVYDYTKSPDYNLVKYTYNGKEYDVISDFSKARNESLKYATKDYILWLDADDMIARQDIAKLRFHLMEHPNTANMILVVDKRADRNVQFLQLRVIPNHQDLVFSGRIHEQLAPSVVAKGIKYSHSDVSVHHFGYIDDDETQKKVARNEVLLRLEVAENQNSFLANLNLAKSLAGSGNYKEAEKYVDVSLNLVHVDKIQMDSESVFLALLTKATLLGMEGKVGEAIAILEYDRNLLCKNDLYLLTIGDLYYKVGEYEKAYNDLRVLTKGGIRISSVAMDLKGLIDSLIQPLLVSALYMGDLETTEFCIKYIFKIPKFRVGKVTKYGSINGNN
jgi:glycosyltransferase involved in cell wall biosynthesis